MVTKIQLLLDNDRCGRAHRLRNFDSLRKTFIRNPVIRVRKSRLKASLNFVFSLSAGIE